MEDIECRKRNWDNEVLNNTGIERDKEGIVEFVISIHKREDVDTNVYAHSVLNMVRAGYDKNKIIHELLNNIDNNSKILHRMIELSRHLSEEENNYIRTGEWTN